MQYLTRLLTVFYLLVFGLSASSCDQIQKSLDLLQADTAYNQGNYVKAISFYQKLVQNNPQDSELQWKLGIAYYSNNEHSNVEKQIEKLQKLKNQKLADDLKQLIYSH